MTLTKSDYMLYLKHPAWMWLKKHEPEKLPPIDENLEKIFDTGHKFEAYAESLFPDGVRLGFDTYQDYVELPQKTRAALDRGERVIFQGRFEVDGLTCIVDILEKVANDYDLIEIKTSTRVKQEHILDLAFQARVLEKAGIKIRNISVIHVNNQYVRDGAVEPSLLTMRTDVSEEVRLELTSNPESISAALKVMGQKTCPDLSPKLAAAGALREWLPLYASLQGGVGDYSVYKLASITPELITEFEDKGISSMQDIPAETKLSAKQAAQVQAFKTGKRLINRENIETFLNELQFPLYFLDYETCGDLVPPFDGMKPYGQIPFQYSLHVKKTPEAEAEHYAYLHQEQTNPGPGFTQSLMNTIGGEGTILVWNQAFEKNINMIMGEMLPDYKEFYSGVNERIRDLMIPFSKGWFVDKDFYGSVSIKKVQPVLAPELAYANLDVSDGMLAQRTWMQTFLYGGIQENLDKTMSDLLTYCEYDTLVMVKIWEVLHTLVNDLN